MAVHSHGRLSLHYEQIGHGPRKILAFHGFGQNAGMFLRERSNQQSHFSLYSFDLFYHGKSKEKSSTLDPSQPLQADEWASFIKDFARKIEASKLELIGYSMGARLSLSLVQSIPEMVNFLNIIAPDGFIKNTWYRFAVGTILGRRIFKRLPAFSFALKFIGALLIKLKLLDEKMYRVALENTSSEIKIRQLYNTWMFLREIEPSLDLVQHELEMESFGINVHLGKHDRIIPMLKVMNWRYLLSNPRHAKVYDAGHVGLISPSLKSILSGMEH